MDGKIEWGNLEGNRQVRLEIAPMAKPRMVRSDKWKKRPAVTKYWAFKDMLNRLWNKHGLPPIGTKIESLVFFVPMPKSWSKKKKYLMHNQLHTQTPDLDNMLKAFLDCLCVEDGHVAEIGCLAKYWSDKGSIYVELSQGEAIKAIGGWKKPPGRKPKEINPITGRNLNDYNLNQ